MRSESEMMRLILGFAEEETAIRAVGLNGSRTDRNAPRDSFQDYDIVYLTTSPARYIDDRRWLDRFGERLIMQEPDRSSLFPSGPEREGRFAYLVQFADGNRIDFTIMSTADAARYRADDTQTVILLDKDGLFPDMPPPSDIKYRTAPPTERNFLDCLNEFWWTAPYVAKGLRRHELLYAAGHMEHCTRRELLRMLAWREGHASGGAPAGKMHKHLPGRLSESERARLYALYDTSSEARCREALFAACAFFEEASRSVAALYGFAYDAEEAARVTRYLHNLWEPDRDSTTFG